MDKTDEQREWAASEKNGRLLEPMQAPVRIPFHHSVHAVVSCTRRACTGGSFDSNLVDHKLHMPLGVCTSMAGCPWIAQSDGKPAKCVGVLHKQQRVVCCGRTSAFSPMPGRLWKGDAFSCAHSTDTHGVGPIEVGKQRAPHEWTRCSKRIP